MWKCEKKTTEKVLEVLTWGFGDDMNPATTTVREQVSGGREEPSGPIATWGV